MPKSTAPKYVQEVLLALLGAGFSAYLVGGCVRDSIIDRHIRDWDICTNALPDEVLGLFPDSIPTGKRHGTITVIIRKRQVEVTTFRSESAYSDRRRPDSVSFIGDLNTDLSRRDFTMNAIAKNLEGELFDPFSGLADIEGRIIRCVGNPEKRFEEDALRMLRALRFSAELGFTIDEETLAAIKLCAPLVAKLSPERVRDEIEKMLLSQAPEVLNDVINLGLLNYYLNATAVSAGFGRLKQTPKERRPRWAAFCSSLVSCGYISDTKSFLLSLRLDGRTVKNCSIGAQLAAEGFPLSRPEQKKLLSKYGQDIICCAAAAVDVIKPGRRVRELKELLNSGECWSFGQLAVNGDDLLCLGYEGKQIGLALKRLLEYVIEHPEANEKVFLQNMLTSEYSRV